jgi:protein phosphatase
VQRRYLAGYFVFDGMGGQPGGEAAAQISSDVINGAINTADGKDLISLMTDSIETAQAAILSRRGSPSTDGMGTTVVGALIRGDELVLGSVGDSRAYHIRGDRICQLTSDHTLVQQLVDAGRLSVQDALLHPQSHILTRCLGSELEFAVDIRRFWLGDLNSSDDNNEWLLLCSDGLYSLVTEEEIVAMVLNSTAEQATQKFIHLARHRGGFDNITAVLVPLNGKLLDFKPREVQKPLREQVAPVFKDEASRGEERPLIIAGVRGSSGKAVPSRWLMAGLIALISAFAMVVASVFLNVF